MYNCIELNREFATKQDLYVAIVKYAAKIIQLKKANVYKSLDKGQLSFNLPLKTNGAEKVGFEIKEGFIYPIINTTKFLDSHLDVHLDDLWKRSLQHNVGKIFYVSDHSLKPKDVIAWSDDVKAFTDTVPWKSLGKDFAGNTQALVFEIEQAKIDNASALKVIAEKRPVQNSVRMRYIDIVLALNSDVKRDKEFKDNYEEILPLIANKDFAEEMGYFWGIKEAAIHKEGSMVLFGSNEVTPILYEPEKSTQEDPPEGTHKNNLLNLI